MAIRKAAASDLDAIVRIYDAVHDQEERGVAVIGWDRKTYPTRDTARAALDRGDLFVLELKPYTETETAVCVETEMPIFRTKKTSASAETAQVIAGAAIINQIQVDTYSQADWAYDAAAEEVMVLHTLVIDPAYGCRGLGRQFVEYYEQYALEHGCRYLRMDTNERNARARAMYRKLGYREAGIVPCIFNGIPGVNLVMLEKHL